MAKLTKAQSKLQARVADLLTQDTLSTDNKEFVLSHFHEAANNNISVAGAFFTPLPLAFDFAEYCSAPYSKSPLKILDLCAGIGTLSYAINKLYSTSPFDEQCDITCIDINSDYIEIGKKIVPNAKWLQLNVTDVDAIKKLGNFDLVISNPPFGNILSFKEKKQLCYSGSNAIYSVIEIASLVTSNATFILPQKEAGFKYSGENSFTPYQNEQHTHFVEQTGIELLPNNYSGTTEYQHQWKSKVPVVEFVEADFTYSKLLNLPYLMLPKKTDLFGLCT